MSSADAFEKLLADGRDSALLRYSLGTEYVKLDQFDAAASHLAEAVKQDPDYSAAWELYGKALTATGRETDAMVAYEHGIDAATRRGNRQALKEMQVFLRRLRKRR